MRTRKVEVKPESKVEFWTVFNYGGNDTVCSKHKSLRAAKRAAKACEKRGGAKHRFLKVHWVE